MKASKVLPAKAAIEFTHGGEDCLAIYAMNGYLHGYCGCEREAFWAFEHLEDYDSLKDFIAEAEAYFTPKKSCGDLTMEDLIDLASTYRNAEKMFYPVIDINEWAKARKIQLPEAKK